MIQICEQTGMNAITDVVCQLRFDGVSIEIRHHLSLISIVMLEIWKSTELKKEVFTYEHLRNISATSQRIRPILALPKEKCNTTEMQILVLTKAIDLCQFGVI